MKYVCYELDEYPEFSMNWHERILSSISKKLAPRVNPDFHMKYNDVVYWWLELTQESIPVREIGFDDNGKAIVAGPFGVNKFRRSQHNFHILPNVCLYVLYFSFRNGKCY